MIHAPASGKLPGAWPALIVSGPVFLPNRVLEACLLPDPVYRSLQFYPLPPLAVEQSAAGLHKGLQMAWDTEINKRVAHHIRQNDGVELTPDEVGDLRRSGYIKIRDAMRAQGYWMPEDDEEGYRHIQAVMNKRK